MKACSVSLASVLLFVVSCLATESASSTGKVYVVSEASLSERAVLPQDQTKIQWNYDRATEPVILEVPGTNMFYIREPVPLPAGRDVCARHGGIPVNVVRENQADIFNFVVGRLGLGFRIQVGSFLGETYGGFGVGLVLTPEVSLRGISLAGTTGKIPLLCERPTGRKEFPEFSAWDPLHPNQCPCRFAIPITLPGDEIQTLENREVKEPQETYSSPNISDKLFISAMFLYPQGAKAFCQNHGGRLAQLTRDDTQSAISLLYAKFGFHYSAQAQSHGDNFFGGQGALLTLYPSRCYGSEPSAHLQISSADNYWSPVICERIVKQKQSQVNHVRVPLEELHSHVDRREDDASVSRAEGSDVFLVKNYATETTANYLCRLYGGELAELSRADGFVVNKLLQEAYGAEGLARVRSFSGQTNGGRGLAYVNKLNGLHDLPTVNPVHGYPVLCRVTF